MRRKPKKEFYRKPEETPQEFVGRLKKVVDKKFKKVKRKIK